ncbi:MAG: NUDIX domain-containing protein [Paracoccaceae bacterium]
MRQNSVRLATRAVIVENDRLLIVNAWPDNRSPLMCAPGGGAEPGQSLPENLAREVYEETGLRIEVGQPCMINEFHDPGTGFHQAEVFFRCRVKGGEKVQEWTDPEGIVTERRWVSAEELETLPYKPDSLSLLAFDPARAPLYDPLEQLTK